jgi:DNA-binding PadR family transcriptional regulator
MLLSHNESTEDLLVKILSRKECGALELQLLLEKAHGKKITLPALYRAIKKLVDDGVVVKKATLFTVNREWQQTLVQYFNMKSSLTFSEGETVSHAFKSLSALDAYWKHTITQLRNMLGDTPIFFYNTHVVWLHLADRKESQTNYLNSFDEEKHYAGFVVGGSTSVDTQFKKLFNRTYLQVDLRHIASIKYDSVTVHGEYIITVKFTKRTTDFVEWLYTNHKTIQELEDGLQRSLEAKLSVKMTIERNGKKADKVRNMLAKNFYIPTASDRPN